MKYDLNVFRVVLAPAVVQGLASEPGRRRRGASSRTSLAEMMRQCPVIVAGRLKSDPYGQAVTGKGRGEAMEVFNRVHDRQATATLLKCRVDTCGRSQRSRAADAP